MSDEIINQIMDFIMEATNRLPDPPRERIKKELLKTKELLMNNRPPRILILGRRGAGKSSLINAIFNDKVADIGSVLSETGKAKWYPLKNSKGSLHILDTRGMGDRTKPESANFEEAIDDIKSEVENICPDAVLFLCKAKEVDAHVARDIENLMTIKKFIADVHGYEIPVAALLTQVDELDPKRIEPPYDHPIKQENIRKAGHALQSAFDGSKIDLLKVIPVSAYAEYENGHRTYDNYWNIDVLVDYLMDVLPNSAQLQLARLTSLKKAQKKVARVLINSTATICAGFAATPIPLADAIPITAAQIGMITGIGYISGKKLSRETAKEFLAALGINVGVGFALREAARALIKYIFPGGGLVISASVAFAGTWGIGEAAIAYFIDNASFEEAKNRFKDIRDKAEKEYGEKG